MTRRTTILHKFVEFIPNELDDGTIYISIPFTTVAHKCFCGCEVEVVTPLSPTDWNLTFDGKTVSLDPSVGNWSLECQSHYLVKRNKVIWVDRWSQEEIDAGRANEQHAKERYFALPSDETERVTIDKAERLEDGNAVQRFWRKLKKWWS